MWPSSVLAQFGRRSSSIMFCDPMTASLTEWTTCVRTRLGPGWSKPKPSIPGFGEEEFLSSELVVRKASGLSGRPTGSKTRSHTVIAGPSLWSSQRSLGSRYHDVEDRHEIQTRPHY